MTIGQSLAPDSQNSSAPSIIYGWAAQKEDRNCQGREVYHGWWS